MRQVWLEINTRAIEDNCKKIIESTMTDLVAVVKANGFGHGIAQVARACERAGAKILAVDDFDEAMEIRRSGVSLPVLIFNWMPANFVREMVENDFIYSLYDIETAKILNEEARRIGKMMKVNLCFDTGMHRFGIMPEDLEDFLKNFNQFVNLDPEGVFSCFADSNNKEYINLQIDVFNNMLFQCGQEGINFKYTHISGSESLNNEDALFDTARCGLAIYGYSKILDLDIALEYKTQILSIKKIPAGVKVGNGLSYTTEKPTTLAVIAVGYSHGYDKRLSNKAQILVNYKKCLVVGEIGMSHTIIDITGVPAKIGDDVVLIGRQGEAKIDASDLAKLIDSSEHEILSRLPRNIERVYNEGE